MTHCGFGGRLTGRRGRLFFVIVLALAASGCASGFHETHFFRSEGLFDGIPNYFRLTICGQTVLSSSRYISGYFDEDVINEYFNEIGQPQKGRLIPVAQPPKTDGAKPGEGKPDAAAKPAQEMKNPALILLLSSNSDDIANQIGALAQSQEFTASLAGLMAAPRYEAADKAESRLRMDQARGRTLVALGDKLIKEMSDTPTAVEAETRLLQFVNQLLSDLGAPAPFKTLDEAYTWLTNNRPRLRQENRP